MIPLKVASMPYRYFLKLGVSVLLTDVDVAVLQNPFDFLYRDSDIEVLPLSRGLVASTLSLSEILDGYCR